VSESVGSSAGTSTAPLVWPVHFHEVDPFGARVKELLDVLCAFLLLFLVTPVLLVAIAAIKLTSPGPVFFRQPRIGYQGRQFEMFKLRTMVHGADDLQDRIADRLTKRTFLKLRNDARVTAVGRILRKYSIDELPQLLNVIRGDMSLVGPRPLLLCDFRKFPKSDQLRRFVMQPGITGLWQVSGRDACTDDQRIALDLEYVDNWSFWFDLKILIRTVTVVLSGRNAA
jgi:lipopolysaccharide/colanic/teichoic acid biosynthesis glycosyltransferase